MVHCILCFASLCGNVSKRRVTSGTSRHMFPVLQDLFIIAQESLSFSTLADDADTTVTCMSCFRKAAKFLKLKTKKKALESELMQIIKQSREERALKLRRSRPWSIMTACVMCTKLMCVWHMTTEI